MLNYTAQTGPQSIGRIDATMPTTDCPHSLVEVNGDGGLICLQCGERWQVDCPEDLPHWLWFRMRAEHQLEFLRPFRASPAPQSP